MQSDNYLKLSVPQRVDFMYWKRKLYEIQFCNLCRRGVCEAKQKGNLFSNMEEKVYHVMVEKWNRMQSFFFCMLAVSGSYAISECFYNLGIEIIENMILFLFIGILCFLAVKFEYISTENLDAIFLKEKVILQRRNWKREIFYADIKEVEKCAVYCEKYRACIKSNSG